MIDIEQIRKNPDRFRHAIAVKGIPLDLDALLEADERRRTLGKEVNQLREHRNRIAKQAGAEPDKREVLSREGRAVGDKLAMLEVELNKWTTSFEQLMTYVPSLPAKDVPVGETDRDNVEIRRSGSPVGKDFALKDHLDLAKRHDMVDFEGARQIAGSRAYALKGTGALLEMAVLRFALDRLVEKGFTPVLPPLLVKHNAMYGTGYFPLGEDNAYEFEKDGLYLTGTSEVGMVAMNANRVLEIETLPLKLVGISPCFRREAGAAGRDTRGLYRVHQFQKVEQVVFCQNDPEVSAKEHYALLQNSEEIVQALELPYRVVAVCTGDMGMGQVRKHDIETWMPSRDSYGETHSCSTFHDFQARRLGIRYTQDNQQNGGKQKQYVHTLNNTAIASPRILIALLENHQNEDGSIHIPVALRPYLNGRTILEPK